VSDDHGSGIFNPWQRRCFGSVKIFSFLSSHTFHKACRKQDIKIMQDDERCCGTGTCLINAQGLCWCGQQWDGEKMCRPATPDATGTKAEGTAVTQDMPASKSL
jgi:hypothetical protein